LRAINSFTPLSSLMALRPTTWRSRKQQRHAVRLARGSYFPPEEFLLTGAATIVLKHCAMVGAGTPAGDNTGDYGTTILLTSETVPPFRLETGFQISGINFYWPNQKTGKTPYPPLFSDGGIVNAYDGMTTTPAADQATSKSPTPRCGPITIFLT
jgi:hypothetical protein